MPKDPKYANVRWQDETHTHLLVAIKADASMQKLAEEVYNPVQSACNLCGLSQRFAERMKELLHHPQNSVGTEWANQHPIVRLWIDKFASLAHYRQDSSDPDDAWGACRKLSVGQDVDWPLQVRHEDRPIWEKLLREDVQPTGPVAAAGSGGT